MNEEGLGSNVVSASPDAGQALLSKGRHQEALEHFANRLYTHPDDSQAFDGASRALIPLICDGSINRVWNTSKRQLLYRTLILQETCDTGPPVFPHVLSGYHTLGDCDAIPKVAAAARACT